MLPARQCQASVRCLVRVCLPGIDIPPVSIQEALQGLIKNYDAVLIGVGANKPRALRLDGVSPETPIEGLQFMLRYNRGEDLPMGEQKARIRQALIDYQGDQRRRDDVSVIGFKV